MTEELPLETPTLVRQDAYETSTCEDIPKEIKTKIIVEMLFPDISESDSKFVQEVFNGMYT
jgi:hypothetical protein